MKYYNSIPITDLDIYNLIKRMRDWKVNVFTGEDYSPDPYNWDYIGKNLFCMAVQGFVYFMLNILFQYRFFMYHW